MLARLLRKPPGDQDLPLDVRGDAGKLDERRVGAEAPVPSTNGRRDALALRGHGPRQHLGRKDEEAVGIADGGRRSAQAAEHGRRIVGAVVGVEYAGCRDCLCAAAARRHLKNKLAFGRHRHRDSEPARRRNEKPGAVVGDGMLDCRIGVSVLADDGDLRMASRRGLGQLDD